MFNLLDYIYVVKLELSSRCNSNCIMCPRVVNGAKFKRNSHMDYDLFKKIIDELVVESKRMNSPHRNNIFKEAMRKIAPHRDVLLRCFSSEALAAIKNKKTVIRLHGFGESFLNPDIFKMLSYLKNKNFYVSVATNCSNLNKEFTKKILSLGVLKEIVFSLDTHIKGAYESIRQGLDYDVVFKNFDIFIKEAKRNDKPPLIDVSLIKLEENKETIQNSYNFFVDKGVKVSLDRNFFSDEHSFIADCRDISCPLMCHTIFIHSTGDVVKCTLDAVGQSKIGDATRQSLREIWLGEKNLRYLTLNQSGNIDKIDICKRYCIKKHN